MEITLKTLTPLWTGGVDQIPDRLHETGLMGSLRWWYEALVRGLGGYACDPTSEDAQARCEFDTKVYEQAKKDGKCESEAIKAGLRSVCPVCYLFGATGWARLFQLRAVDVPMTPLHFRTTIGMNASWLKRVFGGKNQNIDSIQVPYGNLTFQLIPRRYDEAYAKSQFALLLHLATEYGGLGARLQHGFGQILFPSDLNDISFADGLQRLQVKIQQDILRSAGPKVDTPFDLQNFVGLTYEIPKSNLSALLDGKAHVGNPQKKQETRYLPCVFDLRYKGAGNWGMRRWLKQKGWRESSNPDQLDELDLLLGPRSQWGPKSHQKQIREDLRTAGRVFFGMPYQRDEKYVLRIWAFWPQELKHRLPDPNALMSLCSEYMQDVFKIQPTSQIFGRHLLPSATGVPK